jgi:hypothetical protein
MRVFGPLTREAVDATRRLQLEAMGARPRGMGFLLDASGDIPLPDADVRGYAAAMAAKHSDGLAVHVTTIEESGFRGSAVRSALTGIFFVARTPYPRHVVASVDLAQPHFGRVLGADAPALETIRNEIAELRRLTR